MPSAIRFVIHDDDVKRWFRNTLERAQQQERLRQAMLAAAEVIRIEAARQAPGPHIVAKMKYVGRRRAQALIGPDKAHWYYQFFETGAQPHEISARRVRRLVFPGRAGIVFVQRVRHTGMAAQPFLRPAADHKLHEAARAFSNAINT